MEKLERLASALRAASESPDAGAVLSDGEVRLLRTLPAAFPRGLPPSIPIWRLAASIAAVLALGLLAAAYLAGRSAGSPGPIELVMVPTGGARSAGEWRQGDLFSIRASLPEALHLHIVHLDAGGNLEFVFPFREPGTGEWNYLGYVDNRAGANVPLTLPSEAFPMRLRIETAAPGDELLLAFATRVRIDGEALLDLGNALRRTAEEERGKGAGTAAIAERLRTALAERADALAVLQYRVERSVGE